MKCMRCGKETNDKDVFCPECLADMEHYPVKPGTIIHIPQRPEADNQKQPKKKRELSAEEQLKNASELIQYLVVALLALLSALIITGALLVYAFSNPIHKPQAQHPQTHVGTYITVTNPAEQQNVSRETHCCQCGCFT